MSKYARRVDANHGAIRDEFRRLLGEQRVEDTSRFGSPFHDLMLSMGSLLMSVEIKTETGKLTDAQERGNLPYRLVRNLDDVADTVKLLRRWHKAICDASLAHHMDCYPEPREGD